MDIRENPSSLGDITAKNVASVVELDGRIQAERTFADRVADSITAFCGSMYFVWTHVIWFTLWILWNESAPRSFDPFPFAFLTLVVSLEAIFLSTFILVSENRQARVSERRNLLDLHINLLAEQENTKMLELLQKIATKVGIELHDAEVDALASATDPNQLAAQIDETEARQAAKNAPPGTAEN